jgi:hypothetical protein
MAAGTQLIDAAKAIGIAATELLFDLSHLDNESLTALPLEKIRSSLEVQSVVRLSLRRDSRQPPPDSARVHSLPETAGSYPKIRDLLSDSISLGFMHAH